MRQKPPTTGTVSGNPRNPGKSTRNQHPAPPKMLVTEKMEILQREMERNRYREEEENGQKEKKKNLSVIQAKAPPLKAL